MINFIKETLQKILIVLMLIINLSFFGISPFTEAKIKLGEDDFYYSGTQSAEIVVTDSIFSTLISNLGECANYLIGIATFGIRGVIVGWAEIAEMLLTQVLNLGDKIETINDDAMYTYTQRQVNVESIIFNRVKILDANIFKNDDDTSSNSNATNSNTGTTTSDASSSSNTGTTTSDASSSSNTGVTTSDTNQGSTTSSDTSTTSDADDAESEEEKAQNKKVANIVNILRTYTAKWYYILQYISVAFMLVLLIFMGIKMAISTIAEEKATYKKMIFDWIAGFFVLLLMPYIMTAVLNLNDRFVEVLADISDNSATDIYDEYEYGDEKNQKSSSEIETSLYETVRTRAYSMKWTDGFTGMILYVYLIYYAWRFAIIYLKRLWNIIVLTMISPIIAVSYSFNKITNGGGKSQIFSKWLSEYIINVITQIIHGVIYVSMFSIAIQLSLQSVMGMVFSIIILSYTLKATDLLKKIFKLSGGAGFADEMAEGTGLREVSNSLKKGVNAVIGGKYGKKAIKATYKTLAVPLKMGAELGFGKAMEHKANRKNDPNYKKSPKELEEERKKREEEKEMMDDWDKETGFTERKKEIDDLIEQMNTLELEGKHDAEVDSLQARVEELEKEQEMYDEAYIQLVMSRADREAAGRTVLGNLASVMGDMKKNLGKAFDPEKYVTYDEKTGKYKMKNGYMEGGLRWHAKAKVDENGEKTHVYDDGKKHLSLFHRNKNNSIGRRFANSIKLKELLGLDNDEYKALKEDLKNYKNSVLGVISALAGFPALAINPALGIALLGNGTLRISELAAKNLKYRRSKSDHRYKFNEFTGASKTTMEEVVEKEMIETEHELAIKRAKKHKKLWHNIVDNVEYITHPIKVGSVMLTGITFGLPSGFMKGEYTLGITASGKKRFVRKPEILLAMQNDSQLSKVHEKKVRQAYIKMKKDLIKDRVDILEKDYSNVWETYESQVDEKIKKEGISGLFWEESENDKDSGQMVAGDKVITFDHDKETREIYQELENTMDPKGKKAEQIAIAKKFLTQKSGEIIETSIIKVSSQNGLKSVSDLNLDQENIVKISKYLISSLENKGILEKDSISAEDIGITEGSIREVLNRLIANKDQSDIKLQEELAYRKIEHFIKYKYKVGDEIDLDDPKIIEEFATLLDSKNDVLAGKLIRTMKIIKKSEIESKMSTETKNRTIKMAQTRRKNKAKENIAQAVFEQDDTVLTDARQEELFSILSQIEKENENLLNITHKTVTITPKMEAEMNQYNIPASPISTRYQAPNSTSSPAMSSVVGRRTTAERIYGPAKNVTELITHPKKFGGKS